MERNEKKTRFYAKRFMNYLLYTQYMYMYLKFNFKITVFHIYLLLRMLQQIYIVHIFGQSNDFFTVRKAHEILKFVYRWPMAILRFKVCLRISIQRGHTRKKWYSFSTIRKLHLVNSRFLREIFECLPVSISKECADNLNLVKAIFESSICYKV